MEQKTKILISSICFLLACIVLLVVLFFTDTKVSMGGMIIIWLLIIAYIVRLDWKDKEK